MVSRNLNRLRTRYSVCLQNEFADDVMNHAWERKFVYCSVDTFFALRMEMMRDSKRTN